jgi:hypothetical protein
MPSGLENLDGNRFILRYEHPWGGIASNAAPEDLAPNQFVSCDGLFIKNGRLCSINYYPFDPNYFKFSLDGVKTYVAQSVNGIDFVAIYTIVDPSTGENILGIDGNCNTYYYDFVNLKWVLDKTAPTGYVYSCSQMIRGIIYIFDWIDGVQLEYIPKVSLALSSSFVGGKYCMTLDQYLITANTDMEVWNDGTVTYDASNNPTYTDPVNTGKRERHANRYNWSQAQEGYTSFNPVTRKDPNAPLWVDTTNGLATDKTSGFNAIPEVQQEITGCFSMGNVGYILHDTGVTQLTPTASAILGETSIQPFDATLLWDGKDGLGCTIPKSLAVYGHLAIWGNTNGFYLFSGSGVPNDITGLAKADIFIDINRFHYKDQRTLNICGQICNMGVDCQAPELVYNLYIIYTAVGVSVLPIQMIVWSYVFSTKTWTRHTINLTQLMQQITGNSSYAKVLRQSNTAISTQTFKFPSNFSDLPGAFFNSPIYGGIIINVVSPSASDTDSFYLCQYINDGITSIPDLPPVTNLVFKTEEFQLYRKPTVRGVILRAYGTGTLNININGFAFSPIPVNSIVPKLYRSFGIYTDMAPTIHITSSNFNGFITKVHAFGTYAEGEPI